LVVPSKITDTALQYAYKFRSRGRIPALTYLHWANLGSITRSSQPMVGLTNNRSVQDEKLIEAIFQSHWASESPSAKIYGATATNLITDARPTTNAMATFAKGAGTENMDYYKNARKVYLGVDNIHVMRESLARVIDVLREADANAAQLHSLDPSRPIPAENVFMDRQALRKSGWLRYISALLDGTLLVVRNIHVNSSHVLIHCSDGWDRTTQLSSLAQICLDPFFRTMHGFAILIEKDWISFGHRFLDRCGHLSSEKFFLTSNSGEGGGGGGAEAAQAFLASMQNKFTPQHHIKETSPVFHQFLECVRQIQRQYPNRFEFNQRFLERLHYHLYSCQFGTFLHNNEQERRLGDSGRTPYEATVSIWDWMNSPEEVALNKNEEYDSSLDNPKTGDMGVLMPNPKDIRFWHELYGRTDEEMNGRIVTSQATGADVLGPIESAEDDPVVISSGVQRSPSPMSASAPALDNTSPAGTPPGKAATLSTSTPSLSSKTRPENQRQDSFTPFGSVKSTYSLHARTEPEAGPSTPPHPHHVRQGGALPKLPDAFSGGGLKSMWGKISSNASAALSNVRDAYGGVAGQYVSGALGSAPTSHSGSALSGGELQTTDPLGVPWSQREDPLKDRTMRSAAVLEVADNPWASIRSTSPAPTIRKRLSQETLRDTLGVSHPLDPTIGFPSTSIRSVSSSSSRMLQERSSPVPSAWRDDPLSSPAAASPTSTPLPPSRSSSVLTAASPEAEAEAEAEAEEPLPPSPSPPTAPTPTPPPGQQADPLGVGWL